MAVSSEVLPRPTQGEQDQALASGVDELATDGRSNPCELIWAEHMRDALDEQRELALEYEVDLFLALVSVYAPPLSGLQHERVDPEGAHSELASQRLEALVAVALERGKRDVGLGHRASIGQHTCQRPLGRRGRSGVEVARASWATRP